MPNQSSGTVSRRTLLTAISGATTIIFGGCGSFPFASESVQIESGPGTQLRHARNVSVESVPTFRAVYITERTFLEEHFLQQRDHHSLGDAGHKFLVETEYSNNAVLKLDTFGYRTMTYYKPSLDSRNDSISVRQGISDPSDDRTGYSMLYRLTGVNSNFSPPITLKVTVDVDANPNPRTTEILPANQVSVFNLNSSQSVSNRQAEPHGINGEMTPPS